MTRHTPLIITILLLSAVAILLTQTTTRTTPFAASIMRFQSDEGITKSAVTIIGPAQAISAHGLRFIPDATLNGETLFLRVVNDTNTRTLSFEATTGQTTTRHALTPDQHVTFQATHIRREGSTIILTTDIHTLEPGARILIWTTVDETTITLGDLEPTARVHRTLGTGGYWLFELDEAINGTIDIKVTPPRTLEGELADDVIETLLTKVEDFNLIILPPPGHAALIDIRLSLAKAATALSGNVTEKSARELLITS